MHHLIWLLLVAAIILLWLFPPSLAAAIPIILVVLLICSLVTWAVVRAGRKSPTTGAQGLIGLTSRIVSLKELSYGTEYRVMIEGEIWNAYSPDKLEVGDIVTVTKIKGLNLEVQRVKMSR